MSAFEKYKEAYENTRYCIPQLELELKIGQFQQSFQTYLEKNGIHHWAMITAYNPQSKLNTHRENERSQQRLEKILSEEGYKFHLAEHRDPKGEWPIEKSVFIAKIPLDRALQLGREFKQNAIVAGGSDAIPRLYNCTIRDSGGA